MLTGQSKWVNVAVADGSCTKQMTSNTDLDLSNQNQKNQKSNQIKSRFI